MSKSEPQLPIQLFVPTFRVDETLEEIRVCLERGWTGLGFKTAEVEAEWTRYSGLPHSLFVNSNTSGLHLALEVLKRRLGWSDGDEVISTPLTFVSTNHAILYCNLMPVFADVDEYLCLDPASVESRITPRTRAVMFVGMGGNPGRYAEIVALCRRKGISVILDAAHMAGTTAEGQQVGHDADAVVFSFQAVKNLATADAGMVCFARPDDAATARRLSWLGISKDTYERTHSGGAYKWMYDVDELGFKYNGNSVMAAMALVSLRYLDEDNAFRRAVCAEYDEILEGCSGVDRVPMAHGYVPSRHLYQVRVAHRDDVITALNARGIYPGVHYRDNTQHGLYEHFASETPRARQASDTVLSLPLHCGLTTEQVTYVAESLKEVAQ